MSAPPTRRYRLTRDQRLRGQSAFKHIFDANIRKLQGPLTVMGVPNELARLRFGISIGKRAGNAPKRNRIKRLLREAFRLMQHDWPAGYDIVCVVRPHETLTLAEYQRLLFAGIRSVQAVKSRKPEKQESKKAENSE